MIWQNAAFTAFYSRLLKNVMSAARTSQKLAQKRVVNWHFKPIFNAIIASAIVFQQPDSDTLI
jgi:hypothetical protein